MNWDTVFIIVFTLVAVATVVVALAFGVTWGGSWDNILSVRRQERPVAFWVLTAMWLAFAALGAFGVYTQFAGWPWPT